MACPKHRRRRSTIHKSYNNFVNSRDNTYIINKKFNNKIRFSTNIFNSDIYMHKVIKDIFYTSSKKPQYIYIKKNI